MGVLYFLLGAVFSAILANIIVTAADNRWFAEQLIECRDAPEWCAKQHPKRFEAVQAITATQEADDGKE